MDEPKKRTPRKPRGFSDPDQFVAQQETNREAVNKLGEVDALTQLLTVLIPLDSEKQRAILRAATAYFDVKKDDRY